MAKKTDTCKAKKDVEVVKTGSAFARSDHSEKEYRKLLPPANVGKLSRKEIRDGIKAVVARRSSSR